MENTKSESFTAQIDKSNPLNLKSNYNDNIVALKILLNLCDNNEVRNSGQQLLDSFILLNLLKGYSGIKQYHEEYSFLIDKLYTFINTYTHFEKLLRNNNIKTLAFIAPNNTVSDTLDEGKDAKEAVESDCSYIVIKSKSDDFNGYSLKNILENSNLLNVILCKDKDRKFKDEIANGIISIKKQQYEIKNSNDVEELCARKKNRFIQIVTDDNLSDEQVELFNLIEEEYKQLLLVDNKIMILESLLDKLMSKLFVLDPAISKIYKNFKELCEKDFEESIKVRIKLIEKINIDLTTYENIMSSPIVKEKNDENTDELFKSVASLYKEYLVEQINNSELGNVKFSEYLEKIGSNENLINYVKSEEEKEKQKYIDYLIRKLGDNGENVEQPVMSFTGKMAA